MIKKIKFCNCGTAQDLENKKCVYCGKKLTKKYDYFYDDGANAIKK